MIKYVTSKLQTNDLLRDKLIEKINVYNNQDFVRTFHLFIYEYFSSSQLIIPDKTLEENSFDLDEISKSKILIIKKK